MLHLVTRRARDSNARRAHAPGPRGSNPVPYRTRPALHCSHGSRSRVRTWSGGVKIRRAAGYTNRERPGGTPTRIRTWTERVLSALPLPLGYRGLSFVDRASGGSRTRVLCLARTGPSVERRPRRWCSSSVCGDRTRVSRLRTGCLFHWTNTPWSAVSPRGKPPRSDARESNAVSPDPRSGGLPSPSHPAVPPPGLEPGTSPFVAARSVHLSYGGMALSCQGSHQAPAEGFEPPGNGFGGRSASESSPT